MTLFVDPLVRAYLGAAVLTAGPGALMVASHLHSRVKWLRARPVSTVYTTVTWCTAIAGCVLWPQATVTPPAVWQIAAALPVTVVVAWLTIRLDTAVTRRIGRDRRSSAASVRRPDATHRLPEMRVRPAGIAVYDGARPGGSRGEVDLPVAYRNRRASTTWTTGWWLVAVAVGEELLYRGAFLGAARTLPWPGTVVAIVLIVLTFASIHVGFGWAQVGAKLSLSVLTTAVAIGLGSVLPAVVVHCVFNLHYWRRSSTMAVSPAGTVWTT